jgi:hypothetical protein
MSEYRHLSAEFGLPQIENSPPKQTVEPRISDLVV